jgi:hypothetical protein
MSETEKKKREEFWLSRFQTATQLRFEIEDQREVKEQPDFLIRYQGRIVGVEIAELQVDRDKGQSKGSMLQTENSLQQAVVSRAQQLYFAAKNRPVNIQVYFRSGPRQSLQFFNRRDLAEKIANILSRVTVGVSDQCRLDLYSDPAVPLPVAFIYVRGLPSGISPRWQVIAPGWSKEFNSYDVESIMAEKNALISQYRKTVAKNWLLIVADGGNPQGMFRPPKHDCTCLPVSNFDRTFLLCEPDRFLIEW